MPKKSRIIQCQCGGIYFTKHLNYQRTFRCPECGQPPTKDSLRNSFVSDSTEKRSPKLKSNKFIARFNPLAIADKCSISTIDRHGYFRFKHLTVLGAQLYIHWLVLAASVVISIIYWQSPISIILALLSYFSVIFIHEAGHAAMAIKVKCRVIAIRIGLIHGVCEYEQPRYELDDVKIAWSGVIIQILVAILVFSLSSSGLGNYRFFAPITVFLGYFSLLIVPYNLLPSRGLDGKKAWRIIPLLYERLKKH